MMKNEQNTFREQKTMSELKLDAEDLLAQMIQYDQITDELIKNFIQQNCGGKFSELLIDDYEEFRKSLIILTISKVCAITRFNSQFMKAS